MAAPPPDPEPSLDAVVERVARSALVSEIWMGFGSTLEWERLLPVVVEKTVRTIGAAAGSLWLLAPGGETLACAVATGPRRPAIQGASLRLGEGIVGSVAATGEARFVPDVSQSPEFSPRFDADSGFVTRSMIVAAIRGSGRLLGALEVINKEGPEGAAFTQDDLDLLLVVCSAAGQALENARLHGEIQRSYARVAEANRRLVELDRAKSEFMAVASHELRTPLSSLMGYLDLLRLESPELPPAVARPIAAMERSARRLSEVVVRITDALKADRDALAITPCPVEPADLAREVMEELGEAATARRLTLLLHAAPAGPSRLDPEMVKVALSNLVRNAIRFTPDFGRVELTMRREGDVLTFEVADTGMGIAPADTERVFDRFATGADPMTHHSGTFEYGSRGLGLGLSLARAIARAHGGDLRVTSVLGRGSTFRLLLPARP